MAHGDGAAEGVELFGIHFADCWFLPSIGPGLEITLHLSAKCFVYLDNVNLR